MRRRLRGTALGLLLATLVTGCAGPTDAGATPKWESASAAPFVPVAGACHREVENVGYRFAYAPVDCAEVHRTETVHVGTFTGAAAGRTTPPPAGSADRRTAFKACDARATAYAGADWRGALMSLRLVTPEPRDWTAGSRWYRCDLFTLSSIDGSSSRRNPDDFATQRTGSLRGVLTRPSPLRFACFDEDRWENLAPVPCARAHHFEYVGIWTAPEGTYEWAGRDPEVIYNHCQQVIARRVRGTADERPVPGSGTMYRLPSPGAWQRGDRGIRCFYWSGEYRTMSRPLEG
ncbi:septum formation family protein [Micromonospora mirobrigensis]|uniref:Septum formation n=1 Tax=Micromonospora mirobrigensis TaxID=262898 RepID=A0A1C4VG49_9ACTN|nr:septum formation family protein [Micromonospora mirobrigensis]SCE82739.1 Septum formation [Micromonospora mirobrigensis]